MCLGVQQNDNARLKIKTFYLRLNISNNNRKPLPDSVTLCYLPRINGSPLEINGSRIRPDSPGFVTLHRVISGRSVTFGSREPVRVSEGTRYEVYVGEDKLIKGIFRKALNKDEEYNDEEWLWKMDMKCVLEREIEVTEAEVCVEGEAAGVMREGVRVAVRRERRRGGMEEIPEQREVESDGCCCCCEKEEIGSDGGDDEVVDDVEMGMSLWAMDVGIWVLCLGLGYLVSKASAGRKKLGGKLVL